MPIPNISDLWQRYQQDAEMKKHVAHNMHILRCIRGGYRMASDAPVAFNPREDYWSRPERRLLVAYFAYFWGDKMTPAASVRSLALQVFNHFDTLHLRPAFQLQGPNAELTPTVMAQIIDELVTHAANLNGTDALWAQMKAVWRKKIPNTAGEHLVSFFHKALGILNDNQSLESALRIPFQNRLPWFAYLGCPDAQTLAQRQTFFYGFANLLTTSNAYVQGGSMVVAPIIQNTSTETFLNAFGAWVQPGSYPGHPSLEVFGAEDTNTRDCSLYRPILETYGFLNLEIAPYYNQASAIYADWIGAPQGATPIEITQQVGDQVRHQFQTLGDPGLIHDLAQEFQRLLGQSLQTRVWMEWTSAYRANRNHETSADLADHHLRLDLEQPFQLKGTDQVLDSATCLAHLLLDSLAYGHGQAPPQPAIEGEPLHAQQAFSEILPDGLRAWGERALAILHAGRHVLLAGAPGTGKTTLAKFIAQAWNEQAPQLQTYLGEDPPFMTVASSAWSPFHTIGGMFPNEHGQPVPSPGVFIDPESANSEGEWKLRSEAIVVDELNRADMDRCIGELYPLLSGSSKRVVPAGLPGVRKIELSQRFRVIATANMDLSDLVFPISEGLARRFQMIELLGASMDDIGAYLEGSGSPDEQRLQAAKWAVKNFFSAAKGGLLVPAGEGSEDADRLRIGVGFFGLLRDWVVGDYAPSPLAMGMEGAGTSEELAPEILIQSLQTAAAPKDLLEAIRAFRSDQ